MIREWRSLAWCLVVALGLGTVLWLWRVARHETKAPAPATTEAFRLSVTEYARLPGWNRTDTKAAASAFRRSCEILRSRSGNMPMGAAGYAGRVRDWKPACADLPAHALSSREARAFFESRFLPARITAPDDQRPLFTGYYEPLIEASRSRSPLFQQPIYGVPANLVTVDLRSFGASLPQQQLSGCAHQHRLLPCPTRGEIDAHGIGQAPVLLYANDAAALFFLHVQGSGRAKLADGSTVRLAYAGQNGRPYKPIGCVLVQRGLLNREHLSMQSIRAWLASHPASAREIMETDQSYIFFRETPVGDPTLGSPGTEGVPLTPGASVAIDSRIHPFGLPVYLVGRQPDPHLDAEKDMASLFIAQDTGGAIRGPVRADVFWGFGEKAESVAGRMKSGGSFFVLLPKSVAKRLSSQDRTIS